MQFERYSVEKAEDEAARMRQQMMRGQAKDYPEAERRVEAQEKKIEGIVGEFREFVADEMPFVDRAAIGRLSPAELLQLLSDYWDPPASWNHFQKFMQTFGGADPEKEFGALTKEAAIASSAMREKYLEYLKHKAPIELQDEIDDAEEEDQGKTLARLEKATSRNDSGLMLGLHTSMRDFGEVVPGVTEVKPEVAPVGKVEDQARKTFFSVNPKKLYMDKAMPEYLYVVEASRGDVASRRNYDKTREALYSLKPLKVRHKIHLDPDVGEQLIKRFGLGFEDFSKR